MTTIAYTSKLVVLNCARCAIPFAIPERMEQDRRKDHQSFYCPVGHSNVFLGKTDEEKRIEQLERDQAWYKERFANALQGEETARRQAAAARGQVTRIKKRVAKGICPCCKRQFADLHRHMTTQHPDFAGEVTS